MKKETYMSQKAFAGEKQPSMKRRLLDHDYCGRQMYMITLVTEGRRQLFGRVVGRSDGLPGSPDEPRCELSELGMAVRNNWNHIAELHPEIEVVQLQMMPDHLHGILFVHQQMEKPLGKVILGFKQGCNKDYRRLLGMPSVAVLQQQTGLQQTGQQQTGLQQTGRQQTGWQQRKPRTEERKHGLLFEPNYNDKVLMRAGQLETWKHYLNDNPRRLLMKREHPDLFRVQRNVGIAGMTFSAIGNLFLAQRPVRLQVQCSRSMTAADIEAYKSRMLAAARSGAVLVSPSISPGEKAVMRAAFDEGLPVVLLQENGFTDLAKPGGKRMEACSRGQLLILAPWQHHNERISIMRSQCLSLNEMARQICQ